MRLRLAPLVAAALSTVAVAAATTAAVTSSFNSAPAGVPIVATSVPLPQVALDPHLPLPAGRLGGSFGPTADDLLSGSLVVTEEKQMRLVWRGLFQVPFDASLFDFQNEAVILVGGGALQTASFSISAVERVDAEYAGFLFLPSGPSTETDPFLSVTATTVFGGIQPFPTPPATYRVAAVAIDRALLDDVVVHRFAIFAP
jgi:hypothetical protein